MALKLPLARSESVVVQEFEKETLIYNFNTDKAYCLNETSTIVYRHCDGKTSFEDVKRHYKYTDDLIFLALDELQKNNLIKSDKITHFAGMSRREAIRKVGLGTMFALPVITGLVAPYAARAASCGACNLPNATSTCVAGSCQITSCNGGFANCNGNQTDGCETNIGNDRTNCGGCGINCGGVIKNGTVACINGTCTLGSCNAGFANCNGNSTDGCETNIGNDRTNCGGCGVNCGMNLTCQNGRCV